MGNHIAEFDACNRARYGADNTRCCKASQVSYDGCQGEEYPKAQHLDSFLRMLIKLRIALLRFTQDSCWFRHVPIVG